MKCLLQISLAAWLLLSSLCLSAQSASGGNSSWAVGVETGINTQTSCRSCTYQELNVSRTPIALRGEHRFFRWLSIQLELGLQNTRSNSAMAVGSDLPPHDNYPVFLQSRLTTVLATVGPRFQLRIGQGDLGLEYRLGVAAETLAQQLLIGEAKQAALNYNWATGRVNALRLSYTYWATERMAVAVGIETLQALNIGALQFRGDPEATIPTRTIREALVLEDGTYNARQNFHEFQTLTLGIHYRL